jgi:hypothetical protein
MRRPWANVNAVVHPPLATARVYERRDNVQRRRASGFKLAGLRPKLAPPDRRASPQIQAETKAHATRLHAAIAELLRVMDGDRVVRVKVGAYGGIETPEQLDAAVQALRDEREWLIGEGKQIWGQG